MRRLEFLAIIALSSACSALVNPDDSRLGEGDNLVRRDGGTPPADTGAPIPGQDGGAVPDGASGTDAAGPCTSGPVCEGEFLKTCVAGVAVRERCDLGCVSGPGRCAQMRPSNVSADLWLEDAVDLNLTTDTLFILDTTDCVSTMAPSRIVSQEGSDVDLCVIQLGDLRIGSDAAVLLHGSRPAVIMASGSVVIDGVLTVSADGVIPGAGGSRGGQVGRPNGGGARPGAGGEHLSSFDDAGGGGGALCGTGGSGGAGGIATGGAGGGAFGGTWELEPLFGGSGGGRGGGGSDAGDGGSGGGAIQISSPVSVRINGAIAAGGGGGWGGARSVFSTNWGAGGGGGSGGAILIEAPEVRVDGAILSSGGGGGAGASGLGGEDGENGVAGLLERAAGGVASDARDGADGGDGSGPVMLAGLNGGDRTTPGGNGGGGGGGAGCVLVRTVGGTVEGTARLNPEAVPGYRSRRLLTH